MTIGKSHGPIVVLALASVLILWSPVLSQGPPMSDQTMRLERELERTDEALDRIADAVAQANVPLAELALEQAREFQRDAWEAFRESRLLVAAALTKQARERGKVALSLSRQVEQYEGAVVRRLERAAEMLDRVAEVLAEGDRPVLRALYETARTNLERAWEFYRARQYKPALKLADQVEQTAAKLMQAAGLERSGDAAHERRREAVVDFLAGAADATAGCESADALRNMEQARRMLELSDDLSGRGQSDQALDALKRSREFALRAVRDCQGADQLQRRYERLLAETDRLTEQAEGNTDAVRMLQQTKEQLRLAREHMENDSPETAAAALQAAYLTLQQARRLLGINE